MRRISLLFTALLLASASTTLAQDILERVVFRATPTSVSNESADDATHGVLADSDGADAMLLIVEREGRYFWASREDRELVRIRSGVFDLYIDPRGGGYIKVLDQRLMAPDYLYEGPPVQYYEHLTLGLGTFTYWGDAERYDP